MSSMAEAIRDFQNKQLRVYRADPDRLLRDANSAREVVRDHVGRWHFEMLQNCEDAEAEDVLFLITDDAIYTADTGNGVCPNAVASLSGTFLSAKPVGTIGRKGLGFKSVYAITPTPAIFSGDDGILFEASKATAWLQQEGISCAPQHTPYQWLPFWESRQTAADKDPLLAELAAFRTVVRLPLREDKMADEAVEDLRGLPAYVLLLFQHVRRLRLNMAGTIHEILAEPTGTPGVLRLTDARCPTASCWRLDRHVMVVPDDVLKHVEETERQRCKTVQVVVASPSDEKGLPQPTPSNLPLCVYYPTDERSPVPLLLHADFMVSSDRRRLVSVDRDPLNQWIVERMAERIVEFVGGAYRDSYRAAYLHLLRPREDIAAGSAAEAIWRRVLEAAKSGLLFPDRSGNRRLTIDGARVVHTTVSLREASRILSIDAEARPLVHDDLALDDDARTVLEHLGCVAVGDEDVLRCISQYAGNEAADEEWAWASWHWLAAWARAEPYSDAHTQRLERIRSLPILPIDHRFVILPSAQEAVVAWRDDETPSVPSWLPIRLVDSWFRDRVVALADNDAIRSLLEELYIGQVDADVLEKAFESALTCYWEKPSGDPGRFLNFLIEQDWVNTRSPSHRMGRCPVPVSIEGGEQRAWAEANYTYFGRAWGHREVANLYAGVVGIAWARRPKKDKESRREVLEWLSVQSYPRVLEDPSQDASTREKTRVYALVGYNQVLRAPRLILDRLDIRNLSARQAAALIRLLATTWPYYERQNKISVTYTPRYVEYEQQVNAWWWEEVKDGLVPPLEDGAAAPTPLGKCWLPDPVTRKAIGGLLPVVAGGHFGGAKAAVLDWLRNQVRLRSHLSEVTVDEWREILEYRVPACVDEKQAQDETNRRLVRRWYEAALNSLAGQEVTTDLQVQLLCRQGSDWRYVPAPKDRWLADDSEVAQVFATMVWRIGLPERLRRQALACFGLRSMGQEVQKIHGWDPGTVTPCEELQDLLNQVKPFVFAWRRHSSNQDMDKLRNELRRLRVGVLNRIPVQLVLGDSRQEVTTDRQYDHADGLLVLHSGGANEATLAMALGAALGSPSSAVDSLQVLLSCGDDSARADYLERRHNMPIEEVQHLYDEYVGSDELPERPSSWASRKGRSSAVAAKSHSLAPTIGGSADSSDSQDSIASRPDAGERTDASGFTRELHLKDPESCQLVTNDRSRRQGLRRGETGSEGLVEKVPLLTEEQKRRIEQCGRRCAARHLKQLGFSVEEMAFENPGFDLRATRDGHVLLVEVKGHLGRTNVVELTSRQLEEYMHCRTVGVAEHWELWNVEGLSSTDSNDATISRYAVLPKGALRARSLRVDLAQCDCIAAGTIG